jgi:hypothetical protein
MRLDISPILHIAKTEGNDTSIRSSRYKHGRDRAMLDGYFVRGSCDDFIQLSILPSM